MLSSVLCPFGYGARGLLYKLSLTIALIGGPVHADTLTITALGDSLTAGYGLPHGDGFVPQMQAWLDGQGADVTLINAGVSGDTTAGGLARTDWTLTPDVDAMLVALGGNDYLRGLDPAFSRANLDGILAKAQSAGVVTLLVGLTAGANYGLDYKQAFDSMYPDLAATYEVPLFPRFFAGLLAAAEERSGTRADLAWDLAWSGLGGDQAWMTHPCVMPETTSPPTETPSSPLGEPDGLSAHHLCIDADPAAD